MSSKPRSFLSRMPGPVQTVIGTGLMASACAGPAQQVDANNPVNSNGNCARIECLQDRNNVREAVETLLDYKNAVDRPAFYFALDTIPNNDLRLLDIFRGIDQKDSEFRAAVLAKIGQPALQFQLIQEFREDDWVFHRLIEKVPENHPFLIAHLYRGHPRAEAAAKRITDPTLALELLNKTGISYEAIRILASQAAKGMDREKAIREFASPATAFFLREAILAEHKIPEDVATKAFLESGYRSLRDALSLSGYVKSEAIERAFFSDDTDHLSDRVALLKKGVISKKVADNYFLVGGDYYLKMAILEMGLATPATVDKVLKAGRYSPKYLIPILEKGPVTEEAALHVFSAPKTAVEVRQAIFAKGFVKEVSAQDLAYATDEKYLKQLADKADSTVLAAFAQDRKIDGKWRGVILGYIDDQDVIYKMATTGPDMQLRAKAILELQDEALVRKAAKFTLAQLDAATFADSLDPKKREALETALLRVVRDSEGGKVVYAQ